MCRPRQSKGQKDDFADDGTTIADMNVEGFHWYQNPKNKARRAALNQLNVTPKERWAMIWGAFLAYLPIFLIIIVSFILTFWALLAWMSR